MSQLQEWLLQAGVPFCPSWSPAVRGHGGAGHRAAPRGACQQCHPSAGLGTPRAASPSPSPSDLQLGLDMEELEEIEEDAGLGNGGLGRLAGE